LTFFVLASFDIKDSLILPVDELAILIFENLEPSRVGRPDLHVLSFT
jgi:hypothetical protein